LPGSTLTSINYVSFGFSLWNTITPSVGDSGICDSFRIINVPCHSGNSVKVGFIHDSLTIFSSLVSATKFFTDLGSNCGTTVKKSDVLLTLPYLSNGKNLYVYGIPTVILVSSINQLF